MTPAPTLSLRSALLAFRRVTLGSSSIALTAVLALVITVGALTWRQVALTADARVWVRRSHEVLGAVKDLDIALRRAESAQRAFLLTGDEIYLAHYREAVGSTAGLQADLERLTSDNANQHARLQAVVPQVRQKLSELDHRAALAQSGHKDSVLQELRGGTSQQLTREIEAALRDMAAEEDRLLDDRRAAADRSATISEILAGVGTILVLGLLGLAAKQLATARHQLEQAEATQRTLATQLNACLDSISQGVAVFDVDHNLVRWNAALPTLLSLPTELLSAGTAYATIAAHLSKTAQGGEPLLESEEQVRSGAAAPLPGEPVVYERTHPSSGRSLELRRTGMQDGGFVLTVSDMTARAQTEAVLREAQRLQVFGQLTGGIAHDFNNLLTVIMGNLELATSQLETDSQAVDRLGRAMWAAKRGAALTQQLLAFARKQPLASHPIDVSAMLPDLGDLLRRTLGEHIEVRVIDTPGLWPAMADGPQMESAILNLALNARDAMPDGGRLTIEVANKVLDEAYARQNREVAPGDYVMIAVSDTGTGMPPEVVARVFEPFFTTKEPGKGTGLGLAMVYGFARQSGGHVKIYSEQGEGTTVRLYLPRVRGDCLPPEERTQPSEALPSGNETILVVEDEAEVREVAVATLRGLGYQVIEAANGAEGLQAFEAQRGAVDLALLDVVLPGGVKGSDLARRLVEAKPQLRVLFMSGYTKNSIIHRRPPHNGVHLISKPFLRDQLAPKVVEALG